MDKRFVVALRSSQAIPGERRSAKGGSRTPKAFRLPDPKSGASASSATFASMTIFAVSGSAWYHPPPIVPSDLYHGLFRFDAGEDGKPRVLREHARPATIPCPTTG